MDPKTHKVQRRQEEESTQSRSLGQRTTGQEFGSVDELLRHDATQTEPPPAVAERLNESIGREPAPRRSWWSRWFSRRASKS
jgi:hypothetical protein